MGAIGGTATGFLDIAKDKGKGRRRAPAYCLATLANRSYLSFRNSNRLSAGLDDVNHRSLNDGLNAAVDGSIAHDYGIAEAGRRSVAAGFYSGIVSFDDGALSGIDRKHVELFQVHGADTGNSAFGGSIANLCIAPGETDDPEHDPVGAGFPCSCCRNAKIVSARSHGGLLKKQSIGTVTSIVSNEHTLGQ